MSASPRLVVILERGAVGASVLREVKAFTGAGFAETRSRIVAGMPVIVEEMFTNAWFDVRADGLVSLLTAWDGQGVGFRIWEAPADVGAVLEQLENDAGELSLDMLTNVVGVVDAGECG